MSVVAPDLRGKIYRERRLMQPVETTEYLRRQKVANVGTVDVNGWPYVVPLVTAVTRVQIWSGTPSPFRKLEETAEIFIGTKRHTCKSMPINWRPPEGSLLSLVILMSSCALPGRAIARRGHRLTILDSVPATIHALEPASDRRRSQ